MQPLKGFFAGGFTGKKNQNDDDEKAKYESAMNLNKMN